MDVNELARLTAEQERRLLDHEERLMWFETVVDVAGAMVSERLIALEAVAARFERLRDA